jgi:hypothetical protein
MAAQFPVAPERRLTILPSLTNPGCMDLVPSCSSSKTIGATFRSSNRLSHIKVARADLI